MAEVPHILILGVVGLTVYLKRNVVRLSVIDLLLAGFNIPLTPRSDDGHIGSESLYSKLKTNLIVTLTRTAVADSVSALCLCDLNYTLCDNGTRERRTEHILLVFSARHNGGNNVILNELLGEVLYVYLGSACLYCLLLKSVKLVALSYVSAYRDNLTVVIILFEPRNDYRSIKSSRVCEDDLFDIGFIKVIHNFLLRCIIFNLR